MHNPFQQKDELLLEEEQIPYVLNPQDLITVRKKRRRNNLPAIDGLGRKRSHRNSAAVSGAENVVDTNEHYKLKKIVHRDIERQRRQQMGNLHASLRSLLPFDYIKGKRSISDHMHIAVNYIKHLQNRISELNIQKENLTKITNLRTKNSEIISAKSQQFSDCNLNVMASFCQDGVEILISSSHKKGKDDVVFFPLSKVMKMLLVEGLDVVSCVSTKANQTTLYRIISHQADDLSCNIDVMELQKKLEDVIKQD